MYTYICLYRCGCRRVCTGGARSDPTELDVEGGVCGLDAVAYRYESVMSHQLYGLDS